MSLLPKTSIIHFGREEQSAAPLGAKLLAAKIRAWRGDRLPWEARFKSIKMPCMDATSPSMSPLKAALSRVVCLLLATCACSFLNASDGKPAEDDTTSQSTDDCAEAGILHDHHKVSASCEVPTEELWINASVFHFTGQDQAVALAWPGVGNCAASKIYRLATCKGDDLRIEDGPTKDNEASVSVPSDRIVDFSLSRANGDRITWEIPLAEDPIVTTPQNHVSHSRSQDLVIAWQPPQTPASSFHILLSVRGACYPELCGDTDCEVNVYNAAVEDDGTLTLAADILQKMDFVTDENCEAELRLMRIMHHDGYPSALAPGKLSSTSQAIIWFTLTP